jgi:hypothetical protein
MGMIGSILGGARAAREVGEAVGGVAEVLVGNRAERDAATAAGFAATVGQYGAEFASAGDGAFDRFVNALNRLPRPMLALGTLGLFVYAMAEPSGFSVRMQGLNLVPEPLWWLLGAVVSFYFGARELHHQRRRAALSTARAVLTGATAADAGSVVEAAAPTPVAALAARSAAIDPDHNPAVEEWRRQRA